MRRDLMLTSLTWCVLFAQPLFAASGDTKKTEEFHALIAWTQKNGVRQNLGGGIPETAGAKTSRIKVTACSFSEIEVNAKHVFCVSAFPKYRKFLFFILMDVGDGTSIVWRVSSRGKLISTMCTAAGAVQAVPNAAFEAGFLAEREYFLRTMRLPNARERLRTPASDESMR
jgi:hypothetical protein